jgi:hypothetical protein
MGLVVFSGDFLGEAKAQACANAFHEKAGRSQVHSWLFLLYMVFLLPSRRCRHASIRTLRGANRFARCTLGVLVSAGAAI